MRRPNEFVKNAFIIRPFGVKPVTVPAGQPGKKEETLKIDFDAVEKKLIGPALDALGISGRTTAEIMRAGNIREDMFHRLLTADLVVADLSIHNANAFYELGLRHAFRDKHTFLIRSEGLSNYPFDLQTDRYFVYDYRNPAKGLAELIAAIKETISSDREDSPVYRLLPNLRTQDRSRFLSPPREFREAVEQARNDENPGDLRLLCVEAEGFIWEIEGLREVGRAQFELNYHWGAAVTWESIRRHYPDDLEANLTLTRIYQRIYEHTSDEKALEKSVQALDRVSDQADLERFRKSEVLGLVGRKYETAWKKSWLRLERKERLEQALSSHYLREARQAYEEAFYLNLNNYNAGVNALALLMVEEQLGNEQESVWAQLFESPKDEIDRLSVQAFELRSAVKLSLEAAKKLVRRDLNGERDFWLELNEASFYLLTSSEAQEIRLRREFEEALRLAPPAWADSIKDVLEIYEKLGLFARNVKVVRSVYEAVFARRKHRIAAPKKVKDRILLFAGHRVDQEPVVAPKPGRRRFPRGKTYEAKVKKAIEKAVREEMREAEQQEASVLFGICGGANGGEIIFHEVCRELGVKTRLYLAIPRDQFVGRYVSVFNEENDWFDRFNEIYDQAEVRVELSDSADLPRWLQLKPNYDIRRRSGLWMLQHALVSRVLHDARVTLITLWDGKESDAAGGIADLINRAGNHGINVVPIPTKDILD